MHVRKLIVYRLIIFFLVFTFSCASFATHERVRGIYLTSTTAQMTERMKNLIREAPKAGINTFVIDIRPPSYSVYEKNIERVKEAGLHYVARVVVFPHGGNRLQIRDKSYWQKRWKQVEYAISLGADEIQLDYIRYASKQPASEQNIQDVYEVIKYFKQKLYQSRIPLQIDVFGIAAHRTSLHIGQDVQKFATLVDAICPMVYPSHYEPYLFHAVRPYKTVLNSVMALRDKINNHDHVRVYPYIELFNYRYPMSREQRIKYIQAQLQAVRDSGANGWFAWSAGNRYELLFHVLKNSR